MSCILVALSFLEYFPRLFVNQYMKGKINMEVKIQIVDIFCGIGGLTYGLNKSGLQVVAGYDIDPTCRYAYEANNDCKLI